jgi:hypothetical protein
MRQLPFGSLRNPCGSGFCAFGGVTNGSNKSDYNTLSNRNPDKGTAMAGNRYCTPHVSQPASSVGLASSLR